MIDKVFFQILNMSFASSFAIIFVLFARLILKKVPKVFSYTLWSVVLFRLICPVSFESTFIGTIVSIRRSDEYGGKYAGKLGIVKKLADNRVGVEFSDLKNPASGYGLFWFKKENVKPSFFDTPKHNDAIMPAALSKAFLNLTFGAPRASLGVKQVIFSGPKTIVFWLDGTKTIVSCGEGDHNDPYAGFCAAVTKRVFGSTSQAKKVLARTRKETSK